MKINLNEIATSTTGELSDLEMTLAFEIELLERQLSRPVRDDSDWRGRATKALDHMKRAKDLTRMKINKDYFDANYGIHAALIAELRKSVDVKTFMDCVHKAKFSVGVL